MKILVNIYPINLMKDIKHCKLIGIHRDIIVTRIRDRYRMFTMNNCSEPFVLWVNFVLFKLILYPCLDLFSLHFWKSEDVIPMLVSEDHSFICCLDAVSWSILKFWKLCAISYIFWSDDNHKQYVLSWWNTVLF